MASKKYTAPLGASLVVMSSIFYASYGIWTKLMGDFFQGYTASALRSVLVLLILLPIAIFYRHLEPIHLKQNWRYLTGMVLASLFTWGPLYYAILHAGVGISLAVAYASIVIGSFFFGWLFGRERFTKDKAISALLGVIGLALIFSPTLKGVV
jgi:drug/metabolite transporter (DMT)-like permease